MFEDKEFRIPFDSSRRGRNGNSEEKALGRRAIGRALRGNVPSLGKRRRGRGSRVDVPTGGKPGTRRPTGSRRDFDKDGWADEGSTNPVWVGIDGDDSLSSGKKKPKRYYHGSATRLNVGDEVIPPSESGVKPRAHPDIDALEFDNDRYVYLTSSIDDARAYASDSVVIGRGDTPYVYEVEADYPEDDPESEITGAKNSYRAGRARIVRTVSDDETDENLASGRTYRRDAYQGSKFARATPVEIASDGSHEMDSINSLASGQTMEAAHRRQLKFNKKQLMAVSEFMAFIHGHKAWKSQEMSLDEIIEDGGISLDGGFTRKDVDKINELIAGAFQGYLILPSPIEIKNLETGETIVFGPRVRVIANTDTMPVFDEISYSRSNLAESLGFEEGRILDVPVQLFIVPDREFNNMELDVIRDSISSSISYQDGLLNVHYNYVENDSMPLLGSITFSIMIHENGKATAIHDSVSIDNGVQGRGVGNALDARLEQIYALIGVDAINLTGESGDGRTTRWIGATHWPKNGYTWANNDAKQKFIDAIRRAIKNGKLSRSEQQDIRDIVDINSDDIPDSVTPDQLLRWRNAEKFFVEQGLQIEYKKNVNRNNKPEGEIEDSLSSGKLPQNLYAESNYLASGKLRERPKPEPAKKTLTNGSLNESPKVSVLGKRVGNFATAGKPKDYDTFSIYAYRTWEIGAEDIIFGLPTLPDSMRDEPGYYEGDAKIVPINPYVISGLDYSSSEGRELAKRWAMARAAASIADGYEPTYVEALLYAGSRGDDEAMRKFDELAETGRKLVDAEKAKRRESYVRTYNSEAVKEAVERAGLSDIGIDDLYLVHETRYAPEEMSDGSIGIRPLGDFVLKNKNGENATYDRDTIHFALNHIAGGHVMRPRVSEDDDRFIIIIKLSDVLESNPGSVDALNPVDTSLVPPPGEPVKIQAGKFKILKNPDTEKIDEVVKASLEEMGAKHFFTPDEYGSPDEVSAILPVAIEIGAEVEIHSQTPSGALEGVDPGSDSASSPISASWLSLMSDNAIARIANNSKWSGLEPLQYSMRRDEYTKKLKENNGKLERPTEEDYDSLGSGKVNAIKKDKNRQNYGSYERDISLASGKQRNDALDRQEPLSDKQKISAAELPSVIKSLYLERLRFDESELISVDKDGRPIPTEKLRSIIAEHISNIFNSNIILDSEVGLTDDDGQMSLLGKTLSMSISDSETTSVSIIRFEPPKDAVLVDEGITWPAVKIEFALPISILPEDEDISGRFGNNIDVSYDGEIKLGEAFRSLYIDNDGRIVAIHDFMTLEPEAQGQGIGTAFDAKLEQIYRALGVSEIRLIGESGGMILKPKDRWIGATHWGRNGYTWANDESRMEFLSVLQLSAANGRMSDSEFEEIDKILGGLFDATTIPDEVTPEQLLKWKNADFDFQQNETKIEYKKILIPETSKDKRQKDTGVSLSSGKTQRDIKYGDINPNTRSIMSPSDRTSLKGLTPAEIARTIVPNSLDEHIDRMAQRIVPNFDKLPENVRRAIVKQMRERIEARPWLEPDFSAEKIKQTTEMIEKTLNSSPGLYWAFENFGAPSFAILTDNAVRLKKQMTADEIRRTNSGASLIDDSDIDDIASTYLDMVLLPSNIASPNRAQREIRPEYDASDSYWLIDESNEAVLIHEYGHWLLDRFIAAGEAPEVRKKFMYPNASVWLNLDMKISERDMNERIRIAEKYRDVGGLLALKIIREELDNVPINFDDIGSTPRAITSYAHRNTEEMFAEGFVAVMHPNSSLADRAISASLKSDILSLIGVDGKSLPWKKRKGVRTRPPVQRALRDERKKLAARTKLAEIAEADILRRGESFASGRSKRVRYQHSEVIKRAMEAAGDLIYDKATRENLRQEIIKLLINVGEKLATSKEGEGFTVRAGIPMIEITNGVAVARNRHGMKFLVNESFENGKPTEELVERFLAWMEFHGPSVFTNDNPDVITVGVGGWVPVVTEKDGTMFLDVSDIYKNTTTGRMSAIEAGRRGMQLSIADLDIITDSYSRGDSDIPSEAFIETDGDGGEVISIKTIDKFRKETLTARENLAETGSRKLSQIGSPIRLKDKNNKDVVARRVRYLDQELMETTDYWVVVSDSGVELFLDSDFSLTRERLSKDRRNGAGEIARDEVISELLRNKNIPRIGRMRPRENNESGKSFIEVDHRGRGLNGAMMHTYDVVTGSKIFTSKSKRKTRIKPRRRSLASGSVDTSERRLNEHGVSLEEEKEIKSILKDEVIQGIIEVLNEIDGTTDSDVDNDRPLDFLSVDDYLSRRGIRPAPVVVSEIDDSPEERRPFNASEARQEIVYDIPTVEAFDFGDGIAEIGKKILGVMARIENEDDVLNLVLSELGVETPEIDTATLAKRVADANTTVAWPLGISINGAIVKEEDMADGLGLRARIRFIQELETISGGSSSTDLELPGRYGIIPGYKGLRDISRDSSAEHTDRYVEILKEEVSKIKSQIANGSEESGKLMPPHWENMSEDDLNDAVYDIAAINVMQVKVRLLAQRLSILHDRYSSADNERAKIVTQKEAGFNYDRERLEQLKDERLDLMEAIQFLEDDIDTGRGEIQSISSELFNFEYRKTSGFRYQEHIQKHIEQHEDYAMGLAKVGGTGGIKSRARKEAFKKIALTAGLTFGNVRLNIVKPENIKLESMSEDEREKVSDLISSIYPDQIIQILNNRFPDGIEIDFLGFIEQMLNIGGHFYSVQTPNGDTKGKIDIRDIDEINVLAHEVMHAIAESSTIMQFAEHIFLARRSLGDPSKSDTRRQISEAIAEGVSQMTQTPYDMDPAIAAQRQGAPFTYVRDNLTDSYAGKIYKTSVATEAMTRGIEYLFFDTMNSEDEDHMAMVLGALIIAALTETSKSTPNTSGNGRRVGLLKPHYSTGFSSGKINAGKAIDVPAVSQIIETPTVEWDEPESIIDKKILGIPESFESETIEFAVNEIVNDWWPDWDGCRQIRRDAYEIAGLDEPGEADTNINRVGGVFGARAKPVVNPIEPQVSREIARFIMAKLAKDMSDGKDFYRPTLYRAIALNDVEREGFWSRIKEGAVVDIPLLAFSNIGPHRGSHFLSRFGNDVLFILEDSPHSYDYNGFFAPLYTEDDEAETLNTIQDIITGIESEIEDEIYDGDEDGLKNAKSRIKEISQLLDDYRKTDKEDGSSSVELISRLSELAEEYGIMPRFMGREVAENDNAEDRFWESQYDPDSSSPRERISGGRMEVVEIKDDTHGIYGKVVVLRQVGVFDPQRPGTLITPRVGRLASGDIRNVSSDNWLDDKSEKVKTEIAEIKSMLTRGSFISEIETIIDSVNGIVGDYGVDYSAEYETEISIDEWLAKPGLAKSKIRVPITESVGSYLQGGIFVDSITEGPKTSTGLVTIPSVAMFETEQKVADLGNRVFNLMNADELIVPEIEKILISPKIKAALSRYEIYEPRAVASFIGQQFALGYGDSAALSKPFENMSNDEIIKFYDTIVAALAYANTSIFEVIGESRRELFIRLAKSFGLNFEKEELILDFQTEDDGQYIISNGRRLVTDSEAVEISNVIQSILPVELIDLVNTRFKNGIYFTTRDFATPDDDDINDNGGFFRGSMSPPRSRGFVVDGSAGEIYLGDLDSSLTDSKRVIIHEFIHALAASSNFISLMENMFLTRRSIGRQSDSNQRIPIAEAIKDGVVQPRQRTEWKYGNRFIDDNLTEYYSGRMYDIDRGASTESMTRGSDYLFFGFANSVDVDHMATTLGTLLVAAKLGSKNIPSINISNRGRETDATDITPSNLELLQIGRATRMETIKEPSALASGGRGNINNQQPSDEDIENMVSSRRVEVSEDGIEMLFATPIEKLKRRHVEYKDWTSTRAVDERRRKMIADAYELMEEMDTSEEVRRSWDAAEAEIRRQFKMLTEEDGITVEFVDDDPYSSFHEMYEDVVRNKRLKILKTESTGGHPYWSNEVNDMFRAVHDAYGHLATGRGFDRHGEEAAFQAHKRMFPELAIPALNTELRAQNLYLIDRGDFGPQKVGFLPAELLEKILKAMSRRRTGKIITADDDNAYKKGGSHHVSCGRRLTR